VKMSPWNGIRIINNPKESEIARPELAEIGGADRYSGELVTGESTEERSISPRE
jgi:hypothetical protein